MDIRVLKYFIAAAQEENLTKAAEKLHTRQPNLSRQLAQLEKETGTVLFERGSRKITLTEEGMFLRKRAKEIIDLVERTEGDLRTFDDVVSGVIHFGAAETHAMRLLGDSMVSFSNQYPNVQYNIVSGSTIEVTDLLNKGLIDFGVLVEPVDLKGYNYLRFPVKESFGVIMRKDDSLAELKSISPENLVNKRVMCARQQLDGNVLSGWIGGDLNELNIVGTFNLITTPAMLVEAGLGVAFTFDKLVNTEEGSSLRFRPLNPTIETGLYFVWTKNQIFTKPAKLFLEEIKETIFTN